MSWQVTAYNLGVRNYNASRTTATEAEAIEVAIEWLREQFTQRPDIVERTATPTRKEYEIVTGRFRFAGTIIIEETQGIPAAQQPNSTSEKIVADLQDEPHSRAAAPMPKAVAWLATAAVILYAATFIRCCIEIYS